MMYKYDVYFEGRTFVYSDVPLEEDEVFDIAGDIIESDARTRLDNDCNILEFELLDTEEVDE